MQASNKIARLYIAQISPWHSLILTGNQTPKWSVCKKCQICDEITVLQACTASSRTTSSFCELERSLVSSMFASVSSWLQEHHHHVDSHVDVKSLRPIVMQMIHVGLQLLKHHSPARSDLEPSSDSHLALPVPPPKSRHQHTSGFGARKWPLSLSCWYSCVIKALKKWAKHRTNLAFSGSGLDDWCESPEPQMTQEQNSHTERRPRFLGVRVPYWVNLALQRRLQMWSMRNVRSAQLYRVSIYREV